ncbi:MAG: TIGR00159 family protein [Chloroflexi bacterium]|nr:TIGR00159 family protein [Chloroflexota bacterium]
MPPLSETVANILDRFDPVRGTLDILIIGAIFYWLLLILRGTTAMSLVRGLVIILLVGFLLSNLLQLTMLGWLLRNSLTALLVGVPIVFQPELRRALERVGRAGWKELISPQEWTATIDTVARACQTLSEKHYGGLMVLERDTGLQDYIDTGIPMDAMPSPELLVGIFYPNAPLHDGAAVLRSNRVVAAGCVLPLSNDIAGGTLLGMRHRAAVGITEQTDAISVIVSEETGTISVAVNGRLVRHLDEARLRRLLTNLFRSPILPTPGRKRKEGG